MLTKMLVYFICVILKVKNNRYVASHIPIIYLLHKNTLPQNDPDVTRQEIFFTSPKLAMKFWWGKKSQGVVHLLLHFFFFLQQSASYRERTQFWYYSKELICTSLLCFGYLIVSSQRVARSPKDLWNFLPG